MTNASSSNTPQRLEHALLKLIQGRVFLNMDLDEQMAFYCKTVSAEIGVPRVGIWLFSADKMSLVSKVEWDRRSDKLSSGTVLSYEDAGTYIDAIKTDRVIDVSDGMTDPRCVELAKEYLPATGVSSLIDCPLHTSDGLIGVLCVEHVGPPTQWTPAERDFVIAVASMVSLAYESHARRIAETRHQDRDRRLNTFVELAADRLWEIGTDLKLNSVIRSPEDSDEDVKHLLGKHPWEVEHRSPQGITWDDFREMMEKRQSLREVILVYHPPGEPRSFREISGEPRYDESGKFVGYSGVSRDVTRRMEQEAELRASQQRHRSASQLAGLGHWIWDEATDSCSYCSQELAEIFGTTVEEYLARSSSTQGDLLWYHPDDRERYFKTTQKALAEQRGYEITLRIVRDDNEVRYLQERTEAQFDSDGKFVSTAGVLLDITEQKKTEETLIKSQRGEAIGQLTGGVAHDFNNLLAVVMGNLELMRDEVDNEEHLEMIDAAVEAATRGADLTKNMLAFARQARLEPTVVDLNQVVQTAKSWIVRTLPATIDVQTTLCHDLWKTEADLSSVESALLNLILNARDAMKEGGNLTVETRNLTVSAQSHAKVKDTLPLGNYVVLSVTDSGHGIPENALRSIFEPFYTTKGPGGGSGLGLAMISGFMQQSGGTVHVDSTEGQGTTFRLYFKAVVEEAEAESNALLTGQTAPASGKILVAEDESGVLSIMVSVLKRAGYQVVPASSGDEAKVIFDADPSFDLLVTDVVMPGKLLGPALAKELRRQNPKLPVVFLTGYASEATAHGDDAHKCDVRLMKPIRRSELLAHISAALNPDHPIG